MARVTTRQVVEGSAPVRRPKNRKAQIALAAAELFCEHGYHGVGIDEIARAVGITGPALYRHFPNKYAMLVHATRELSEAVLESTRADDLPRQPELRLDRMLAGLSMLAVQRRRVGGLYQWEGRHLEAPDRARLRSDLSTLVDRITGPLSELRPELATEQTRIIGRGVLSVMGSLSTHRAAIGPARAQELLHSTGWSLLRADLARAEVAATTIMTASTEPDPRSRRETIMTEALRLFHVHGYHSVSMEDIAIASGTKASSLYRHFPGKAELLAAVYYRAKDRVAAATVSALSNATDPRDALGRLADSYVDLVFGHSDLVTVYQAENTSLLPEPDRHELRKAQRLHVEEWVRILDDLRPDLTTPQTRILVHATLNLISDLGRYLRFDASEGLDRVVASLAHTALRGGNQRPKQAPIMPLPS